MRFAIVMVFLALLIGGTVGCKAFSKGLTGEEATETQKQIDTIVEKAKATGDVNLTDVMDLVKRVNDQKENKMPWYEWVAYIMGISAGTYLGTRQLRQGTIGTIIASVLGVKKTA